MIMERQEHFRGFQIVSGYSFVWVVLAVLLLSVCGWCRCDSFSLVRCSGSWTCYGGLPQGFPSENCSPQRVCGGSPGFTTGPFCDESTHLVSTSGSCCTTQCEADSIACVSQGKDWNSAACQCSDPCGNYRTQCESLGGEFEGGAINKPGSPGTRCCNGVCNLCTTKASEEQWEKKKYYCCSQNKAPPAMNNCAIDSPPVGCGISTKFKTNSDNGVCRDPNLSEDASQSFYENCSGVGSSSSEGGNSSGAGSSGTDGSSSSGVGPYPEGCDECPWLDSILDTLIATKGKLQGIEECLENATVCMDIVPGVGDTNDYAGYLDSIIVLLDSGLSNDRYAINYLGSIDSSLQKMMDKDSVARETERNLLQAGLKNDTNIRRTLADGNYNVDTNFISLKKAIYDLDTATMHHLDSIVKHLPDSILDSIRKYQDSALDRFDSALWGKGVGFSLIDSMIDSVVKYFQVSNHYDSAYAVMFGESMDRLMSKMDEMSFGIDGNLSFTVDLDYGPLGYGDTASVTLRDDMRHIRQDITNAILRIDTSVGNDLENLLREQKNFYTFSTGYGATSGSSTLKSDIEGIATALSSIGGSLQGGTFDSNGIRRAWRDSAAKYNITDAEYRRLYDSTESAWGADRLEGAFDSSYAYGGCVGNGCPPCSDDSCMGTLNVNRMLQAGDSVIEASGAGEALRQSVQRQRDSLSTQWDSAYAALKEVSFFKAFDSTFLANIGAKIPNTNTCPEDCFRQQVDGTYANVRYNVSLDWKLCYPVAPNYLNGLNAFDIIKLLARILTVVTCISIIMWEISSRRGGIGL